MVALCGFRSKRALVLQRNTGYPLAMHILTVEPAEHEVSVLEYLQRRIPAAPLAYLRQLLKQGKILGPDGPLAGHERLASGTLLHLPASARLQEFLATPATPTVKILFESRELLIADKPAGLAIHASVGHEIENLTAQVEALLRQRHERFQVAPIHRLDLETSGPVLFGKGKQACGELGKLFMRHAVDKVYLALASGKLPGSGELVSTMLAKGKEKEALASYRTLAGSETASLLEITLHTGRQHQIRVQLAELGHPIFGDRRYGGPCPRALARIFLHCRSLAFIDPFSGAALKVESPLPDELGNFMPTCNVKPTSGKA